MTREDLEQIEGHIISAREQLQEDIISIMESNFGEVEYLPEVLDNLCQATVDRTKALWNDILLDSKTFLEQSGCTPAYPRPEPR